MFTGMKAPYKCNKIIFLTNNSDRGKFKVKRKILHFYLVIALISVFYCY